MNELEEGSFAASIAPNWTVGPVVHGGCLAALCAVAARSSALAAQAPESFQPLALSAHFLRAPESGEVRLDTVVRKQGRRVFSVDVELSQNDVPMVSSTVAVGELDDGDPLHEEQGHASRSLMPVEPPPDAVRVNAGHPVGPLGRFVRIAQGFDLRVDPSVSSFLEGKQGPTVGRAWVRPFEQDEANADTMLPFALMLGDISPPVMMNRGLFGWDPTIQITVYMRRFPVRGWLRVFAESTVIGKNWLEVDQAVIDSSGEDRHPKQKNCRDPPNDLSN